MSMEDIRTYDADVAALAVQTLVMEMDKLFEVELIQKYLFLLFNKIDFSFILQRTLSFRY